MDFILKYAGEFLKEKSILAITSKIVSISENRIVSKKSVDKTSLIKKECDHYLGETQYGCHLTIKHGLLVPSSGIDESNSQNEDYILYPKDPYTSAKNIIHTLKQKLSLDHLGIIITDSHTSPLKVGVAGIALTYSGFSGVKNQIGHSDLFNRPLKITKINMSDALAASAVLLMGEGSEQKPLAIIQDSPVTFTKTDNPSESQIPVEEDLYFPLYKHHIFKKN